MTGSQPVALVTGASGFVGRHLTPILEGEGWTVRRALRTPTASANDFCIESVDSATNWKDVLVGVDAVIHLAARVHHQNDDDAVELYRNVNIEGTLHLAHSAANAGVRQFIFVSTVLVHGRSNDGRAPFSEDNTLTPSGIYGMSKAAAETGLRNLAQDSDMSITVIRPPLVYGAGAKGNFKLLTRAVKLGIPLPFSSINNRRAFLAVENLCSFIVQRLARAGRGFDVFLVADQEQVSTPEFIRRLAGAVGTAPRMLPVPIAVLSALLKLTRRREARDSIIGSLELDVSKAAASGWRPQVTLDEGLRLAIGDNDAPRI
jgi:UDP-glucose 4-epimerase